MDVSAAYSSGSDGASGASATDGNISTFQLVEMMLRAYYWALRQVRGERGLLKRTFAWTQGLLISCSPLMYKREGHEEIDRFQDYRRHFFSAMAQAHLAHEHGEEMRPTGGLIWQLIQQHKMPEGVQLAELEREFTEALRRELSLACQLAGFAEEIHEVADRAAKQLRKPTRTVVETVQQELSAAVLQIREDPLPEPFRRSLASAGLRLGQTVVRADAWVAQLPMHVDTRPVTAMRETLDSVADDMRRLVYLAVLEINRLTLVNVALAKHRVRRSDLKVPMAHLEAALAATSSYPLGRWTPSLRRHLSDMQGLHTPPTRPGLALQMLLVEHEAAAHLLQPI